MRISLGVLFVLLLSGCGSSPVRNPDGSFTTFSTNNAVAEARSICRKRSGRQFQYVTRREYGFLGITDTYVCLDADKFQREFCPNLDFVWPKPVGWIRAGFFWNQDTWKIIRGDRKCPNKRASDNLPKAQFPTNNMNQQKRQCQSLGFTPGTEKFGNCVLTLMEGN